MPAYGRCRVPDSRFALCASSSSFSPAGNVLVLAAQRYYGTAPARFTLFDPRSGRTIRQWQANLEGLWEVAFSPDGHLLASCGGDGMVLVWRMP